MRALSKTIRVSSSGDMSQATLESEPIAMSQAINASIHAVFSGSPVGTLKLQASNDTVNWVDISDSSYSVSASGSYLWDLTNPGYGHLRLYYTRSSGSGTLSATFVAKEPS